MNGLKNVRNRHSDALTRVAWDELEKLLAVYFRGQGFHVDHVGTGGTGARFDGGIDLKLRKDDAYILVQCKHWNAKQVPHNDVHQLIGVMVNESATGAILVTSGEFTRYAIESARKHGHVDLIDGMRLREMIGPLPEVAPDSSTVAPCWTDQESWVSSRRAGGQRKPADGAIAWLLKVGFAVAAALVLMSVVRHGLTDVNRSASQGATAVHQGSPMMPDERRTSNPFRSSPAPSLPTVVERVPTPQTTAQKPMTEAELREHERRNAEAMKILEKSTPQAQ